MEIHNLRIRKEANLNRLTFDEITSILYNYVCIFSFRTHFSLISNQAFKLIHIQPDLPGIVPSHLAHLAV